MNYPDAMPAGSGIARNPAKTADRPRISMQLEQLDKALSACHQGAGEIECVADRILGPVPQEATKGEPKAPVETIERRLAELIDYAERLSARLQYANTRLNSAV